MAGLLNGGPGGPARASARKIGGPVKPVHPLARLGGVVRGLLGELLGGGLRSQLTPEELAALSSQPNIFSRIKGYADVSPESMDTSPVVRDPLAPAAQDVTALGTGAGTPNPLAEGARMTGSWRVNWQRRS